MFENNSDEMHPFFPSGEWQGSYTYDIKKTSNPIDFLIRPALPQTSEAHSLFHFGLYQ